SRRSRSSASTAMSASETGDWPFLSQVLTGALNQVRASAPASRTAAVTWRFRSAWSASDARNGQALDSHRRRIDAEAEDQIVRRRQAAENVVEVTRNGDLAHRIGQLAVLDPEPGGAAAVVAGHHVGAHA